MWVVVACGLKISRLRKSFWVGDLGNRWLHTQLATRANGWCWFRNGGDSGVVQWLWWHRDCAAAASG